MNTKIIMIMILSTLMLIIPSSAATSMTSFEENNVSSELIMNGDPFIAEYTFSNSAPVDLMVNFSITYGTEEPDKAVGLHEWETYFMIDDFASFSIMNETCSGEFSSIVSVSAGTHTLLIEAHPDPSIFPGNYNFSTSLYATLIEETVYRSSGSSSGPYYRTVTEEVEGNKTAIEEKPPEEKPPEEKPPEEKPPEDEPPANKPVVHDELEDEKSIPGIGAVGMAISTMAAVMLRRSKWM